MSNSPYTWKKGFDRHAILNELKKIRIFDQHGKCSFVASWYAFWHPVLESAIRSSKNAEFLKARCIKSALRDSDITLNDPQQFLSRCNIEYRSQRKRPTSNYYAVFDITYEGPRIFRRLRNKDAEIFWHGGLTSSFSENCTAARIRIFEENPEMRRSLDRQKLTSIIVKVKAYDENHAFSLATDNIDVVRGILNITANRQKSLVSLIFTSQPHAVNRFRLGPIHSLHKEDGDLATQQFWYEPFWAHNTETIRWKNTENELAKFMRKQWKSLHTSSLYDFLREAIIRYCRSLDSHDPKISIIELWSTLEFIFNSQSERSDSVIDRTQRLFSDQTQIRQVLLHIREIRNSTAHSGASKDDDWNPILFQAELIVNRMIYWIMTNQKLFHSKEDVCTFFSIAGDSQKRKKDLKLRRDFEKFMATERRL